MFQNEGDEIIQMNFIEKTLLNTLRVLYKVNKYVNSKCIVYSIMAS